MPLRNHQENALIEPPEEHSLEPSADLYALAEIMANQIRGQDHYAGSSQW